MHQLRLQILHVARNPTRVNVVRHVAPRLFRTTHCKRCWTLCRSADVVHQYYTYVLLIELINKFIVAGFAGSTLSMLHASSGGWAADQRESFPHRSRWHGQRQTALLPEGINQHVPQIMFENVHERLVNAVGGIPL